MKQQIIRTLETLADPHNRPEDIKSFIELAPAASGPPPSITWTLIAILACRKRKKWAWEIIQPYISEEDEPDLVSATDVLESVQRGIVRQHPEWEYEIDGNGSHVRNRVDGEIIHIDALNGPEGICIGDLLAWIKKQQTLFAKRLHDLHPSGDGIGFVVELLIISKVLHGDIDGDLELCRSFDEYELATEEFVAAWGDPAQSLWLDVQIEDWTEALQMARATGQSELERVIRPKVKESHERWLGLIQNVAETLGINDEVLHALADANHTQLTTYLESALAGGNGTWAALEIIKDDPSWCPRVYEYFQEPGPMSDKQSRYLVHHGYRTVEVIEHLADAPRPDYKTIIELSLEGAPELLVRYLPLALRASFSEYRLTAAAVLALLDDEWSRSEVLSLLQESSEQDATVECRAALRESTEPKVRKAVIEWEASHPGTDAPNTFDRYAYDGGCERSLRMRMDINGGQKT